MAFPVTLIYGCWERKKQDKIKKIYLEAGNQGCFRSLKSLYPRTIHLLSFFQVNTSGEECLLKLDNPKWNDVNMVTSQLKLFFRKLPDPIFTTEMYNTYRFYFVNEYVLYFWDENGVKELAEKQLEQGRQHVHVVPLGIVQLKQKFLSASIDLEAGNQGMRIA